MNTLFADGVRDALRGSKWLIFHCRIFSRSFRLCKKTLPIPVAILDSSASLFCNRSVNALKIEQNKPNLLLPWLSDRQAALHRDQWYPFHQIHLAYPHSVRKQKHVGEFPTNGVASQDPYTDTEEQESHLVQCVEDLLVEGFKRKIM